MPKRKKGTQDADEGEEEGNASQGAPCVLLESFGKIAEAAVAFGDIRVDNGKITLGSKSWQCTHEGCPSLGKLRFGGMKNDQPLSEAHKAICEHIRLKHAEGPVSAWKRLAPNRYAVMAKTVDADPTDALKMREILTVKNKGIFSQVPFQRELEHTHLALAALALTALVVCAQLKAAGVEPSEQLICQFGFMWLAHHTRKDQGEKTKYDELHKALKGRVHTATG